MNFQKIDEYRAGFYSNVNKVGVSAFQGRLYYISSGKLCVSSDFRGSNTNVLADKIPDFSGGLKDSLIAINQHGIYFAESFTLYHYSFEGKLVNKTKFRSVVTSISCDDQKVYFLLLSENTGAYTISVYNPSSKIVDKLTNTKKEVSNLCVYEDMLYFDKDGDFSGFSLTSQKNLNFSKLKSGNCSLEPMYIDVEKGSLWVNVQGTLLEYNLPKDPKETMSQKDGEFDLRGVMVDRGYGSSYFDGNILLYTSSYYEFSSLDARGNKLEKISEHSHGECQNFCVLGQHLLIDLAAMSFDVRPLSSWPQTAIWSLE